MAAQHDELMKSGWRLGAGELAAAFAAGTLTPLAVWQDCDARIRALNPELNALIALNPEAEAAAEASTQRWQQGRPLSPLDGVPVTIKDNLNVAGLATTWGNRALADRPAEHDELSVARCRRAGMVILGKTNVPEFTLEGYTDNPLFGVTRNPWNSALTPGGSTGGGVASVAAGFAPLAIGTDGGGSIRRPASHTGLVGFKPSIGAVARVNSLPQVMLDFEVIGPIGRSVADTATLFNIMAGEDARDRKSLRVGQGRVDCTTRPERLRIPATGLALVAAQPAWAQEQDAADDEAVENVDEENVIVVTGISAALSNAQDFKERADTVGDFFRGTHAPQAVAHGMAP